MNEKNFLGDFSKELDKEFSKSIKRKSRDKLKIIGWIASVFSFIGILLNAYKIIWCWPVWCVANIFWIYWAIKKKEGSQIFLWIVFTLANLYGWYIWIIM